MVPVCPAAYTSRVDITGTILGSNRMGTPAKALARIDSLIREGKTREARAALKDFVAAPGGTARQAAARTAELAHRSGAPDLGIRVLRPYIRPETRRFTAPTSAEILHYAVCLTRVGAIQEAIELFGTLGPDGHPDAALYSTFALVDRWDYAPAIPLLRRYLASALGPYQTWVGRINLASALIYEGDVATARAEIDTVLREADASVHRLVRGKALQLMAAVCLDGRDLSGAGRALDEAQALLSTTDTLDALFIRKWRAFLDCLREGWSDASRARLNDIRQQGAAAGHWETERDCDRFEAIERKDEALLLKLWFGTPYPSYRARLISGFGRPVLLPRGYDHAVGGAGRPAGRYDVARGTATGAKEALKEGQLPHRLLATLASDFYRPFRIAALHAALHPGNHYNPASAPARVHAAVQRTRGWLDAGAVPLLVTEESGFYHLAATRPWTIHLTATTPTASRSGALLEKLRKQAGESIFTASDATRGLDLPYRTVMRVLESGLKEGAIERTGKARSVRYRFR